MNLCLRTAAVTATLLLAATLPASCFAADNNTSFHLVASYDRPGIPVPRWEFRIGPDGQTTYTAERSGKDAPSTPGPLQFTFSHAGMLKLQKLLDDSHDLKPCETKTKGLANMGMKTVSYQRGDAAPAQCSFNYTDNKTLSAAIEYLTQASFTIEQGVALERAHKYDRLGLDPVMTQLATAARDGHATELQAIRPVLQSLVQDDQVLERVRQKASQLLAQADRD